MTWTEALQRALQDPEALMAASGNGDALRPLLMRLCVAYLLERRTVGAPRDDSSAGDGTGPGSGRAAGEGGAAAAEGRQRVRDPVAHFHFGNGALLQDLHWRYVPS